ncbi:MAG TPA: PH domain-containing protein [Prosthecobacter sp.]|nr:PH domain-containing protein [Prosthecobacter sp.]
MIPDDLPTAPAPPEETLWKGHTSQWVHFWYYLFCLILLGGIAFGATLVAPATAGLAYIALIVPVLMWVFRWWLTRCTVYELTTQRLKISAGILNRRHEELELYRVKDYAIEQPLFLRIFGLGNLTMVTSDATTPRVTIVAVPGVEDVREKLRTAVQGERDRKRVREMDVDNADVGQS